MHEEYLRAESEHERMRRTINDQAMQIARMSHELDHCRRALADQFKTYKHESDRLLRLAHKRAADVEALRTLLDHVRKWMVAAGDDELDDVWDADFIDQIETILAATKTAPV